MACIRAALELDFCDSWQLLSHFVSILLHRRPQPVKIDLLMHVQLSFWPFAATRITRVKHPRSIGVPGRTAASNSFVDFRTSIGQQLARARVIEMKRAVPAPILGQGNSDYLSIRRRHEPIDGRRSV